MDGVIFASVHARRQSGPEPYDSIRFMPVYNLIHFLTTVPLSLNKHIYPIVLSIGSGAPLGMVMRRVRCPCTVYVGPYRTPSFFFVYNFICRYGTL